MVTRGVFRHTGGNIHPFLSRMDRNPQRDDVREKFMNHFLEIYGIIMTQKSIAKYNKKTFIAIGTKLVIVVTGSVFRHSKAIVYAIASHTSKNSRSCARVIKGQHSSSDGTLGSSN